MPVPQAHRTQQARSAETQAKLLDATIECLIERGFGGTSTTEVCRRAGVSRGAQLHHYPTKEKLLAAAVERLFERRHQEFRAWLGSAPDLGQALAGLWAIYVGGTIYAWMELLIAARTDPPLQALLRQVDDRFMEDVLPTCRSLLGLGDASDRQVHALARLILSVFDGLALNHTLGGRDQVAADVLRSFGPLIETARRSTA